jgi:outer membrane lipoprotein carrier protein
MLGKMLNKTLYLRKIKSMKQKVFFSIIFLYIIFSGNMWAQSSVLTDFQSHFNRTKTFVADFQQTYYDAMLDQTAVSNGRIFFRKPGLMRWNYEKPDLTEIIIGKEKIWIYDPDLENVTIQYLNQVSRLDSLSFLLKNEHLNQHFTLGPTEKSLIKNVKHVIPLFLKPKKASQYIAELQLALDKKTYQIQQFVIVDHQKNHRKIDFNDMILNVNIDISRFEFVITEGMEVIDEMDN